MGVNNERIVAPGLDGLFKVLGHLLAHRIDGKA